MWESAYSFWIYWRIVALKNKSTFQAIISYCIIYSNCHQRNQRIIALWITIAFEESRYYCNAKWVQRSKIFFRYELYISVENKSNILCCHLVWKKNVLQTCWGIPCPGYKITQTVKLSPGQPKYIMPSARSLIITNFVSPKKINNK